MPEMRIDVQIVDAEEHLLNMVNVLPDTIIALEDLLHQAFNQTQSDVHVITGSLRGSGKVSSDFEGDVWTGIITYGGDAPGFPNDPVEYAGYEMYRGGDHDFLRNVHLFENQMREIILAQVQD